MNSTLAEISDTNTTIAAISTAPGVGGIAVIRISGPEAIEIADKVWCGKSLKDVKSHTVHLGKILDSRNEVLDQGVATVYRAPASFTGQNTVELAVHGSKYIQKELLQTLINAGAILARPGEFTRRAFVNGKLSLTQAEAVADIIAGESRGANRLAMKQLDGAFAQRVDLLRQQLLQLVSLMELELDFSEEDVTFADRDNLSELVDTIISGIERLLATFQTGNAIKDGIPVAIVGPTNAGKSSLLNALLEYDRAIVSDIHGTTRDTVEETLLIGDYLFRFIDTAGLRETTDPIEQLGIERSRAAMDKAHIVVNVIDSTTSAEGENYARKTANTLKPHQHQMWVYNKSDLNDATISCEGFSVSAKNGNGIEQLRKEMTRLIDERVGNKRSGETDSSETSDNVIVTNQRHAAALERALRAALTMREGLSEGLPTDLVAQDGREVLDALGEITGQITTDEILGNIFSKFCIGK